MYFFHADAVALGGTVERPTTQTIGALAACSLSVSGGHSSASTGKFDNGLVKFESSQSDLTGGVESRNGDAVFVTGVSVVISGLNIRHMFMADQVVLRLAAEHKAPAKPKPGQPHPAWGEPSIITTGSHFHNLKIAGHAVTLDMAHDVFHKLPTYSDCQQDWETNWDKKTKEPNGNSLLAKTLMGCTLQSPPNATDPLHLQEVYQGFLAQRGSPNLRPSVVCSFVKNVTGLNGGEITNCGPIIRIPQFGTIYLGEVIVSQGQRRVNMFRLQLGSPDSAGLIGGSGSSNGGGYP